MNLSIFQNFTTIIENKPFVDILTDIKSGKYIRQVTYIRKCLEANKTESYEKAKKGLAAFTPSGLFEGGRNQKALKKYSGIIVLDFDKLSLEDLDACRQAAIADAFTLSVFTSPSGNGLKVFVQTKATPKTHKHIFIELQSYYELLTNLSIDKSGKDITRLCFVSFDADLYYNPNASIFDSTSTLASTSSLSSHPKPDSEPVELVEGTSLSLSKCLRLTQKSESFTPGNRNNFVYQLACNLNREGVSFEQALSFIQTDYNYDEKEVITTVQSAYKNTDEFALDKKKTSPSKRKKSGLTNVAESLEKDEEPKKRIPAIDKVENFLLSKYRFRNNTITNRLEYRFKNKKKWHRISDFIENSMLRVLLKNNIRTNLTSLRTLLYSDFCELFNPFTAYFESLPPWDEKTDHIAQLANTITTTKQDLWQTCFKKWIVAMVASVLKESIINQTVIVFTGKQGIGKTTWIENLVPAELKAYLFSGTINPNNKDTLLYLSECMLINLDELENLNRSEIGNLKELITKTHIRLRRAYGHNNETLSRTASFAGSVNTAQFLNDTTGSRRFLTFELSDINYKHQIASSKVYAQALSLFKSDFRFWFNQQEIQEINQNNEQFRLRSPEEELLLTWFEACSREEATAFLNASQIMVVLTNKANITISDSSIIKLGKALVKNNFMRFKSNGKVLYAIRELNAEEVNKQSRLP